MVYYPIKINLNDLVLEHMYLNPRLENNDKVMVTGDYASYIADKLNQIFSKENPEVKESTLNEEQKPEDVLEDGNRNVPLIGGIASNMPTIHNTVRLEQTYSVITDNSLRKTPLNKIVLTTDIDSFPYFFNKHFDKLKELLDDGYYLNIIVLVPFEHDGDNTPFPDMLKELLSEHSTIDIYFVKDLREKQK